MKRIFWLLVLLLLAIPSAWAQDVTLTGTLDNPDGTGFNGYLYLQLQTQVSISSTSPCTGPVFVIGTQASQPLQIQVTNGALVNPPKVYGSTCTSPYGTPYLVTVRDTNGNLVFTDQWLIIGPTQNIGDITPATNLPPGPTQYITGAGTLGSYACFTGGNSIGNCSGGGGGSMVYPLSGVACSTGSAWCAQSYQVNGSGAGLVTGPSTSTNNDVAIYDGSSGQLEDSGVVLSSLAPTASPTFSGTVTVGGAETLFNGTFGTGSGAVPQIYIDNPSATGSITNTYGTIFGANEPSSFFSTPNGNFLNYAVNGTSLFNVSTNGGVNTANVFVAESGSSGYRYASTAPSSLSNGGSAIGYAINTGSTNNGPVLLASSWAGIGHNPIFHVFSDGSGTLGPAVSEVDAGIFDSSLTLSWLNSTVQCLGVTSSNQLVGIGRRCSSGTVFNVQDYGATGNTRSVEDAVTTASSTTLTSATANFTSADTGKTVTVSAGAAGVWSATYTSGGTITGSTGNNCVVNSFGGGGSSALGVVYLTSANTIAANAIVYMTAFGTGFTAAPTSATLANGSSTWGTTAATCSGTIVLAGKIAPFSMQATATYVNATTITLSSAATTGGTGLNMTIGTDDTTAIQNTITAASEVNGAVYIPTGNYQITSTLTIPSSVSLYGDGAFPDYGAIGPSASTVYGDIFPSNPPFLQGTIIQVTNTATDAIHVQAVGGSAHIHDIGILFDPTLAFWESGNGIVAAASTTTNYAQMDGTWENIRVWGTDGKHFAYVLTNTNYWTGISLSGYGGGGIAFPSVSGTESETGNAVLVHPYFATFTGNPNANAYTTGADGFFFDANTNIFSLVRPQSNLYPVTYNQPNTILANWPVPPLSCNEANVHANSSSNIVALHADFEQSGECASFSSGGIWPSSFVGINPTAASQFPSSGIQIGTSSNSGPHINEGTSGSYTYGSLGIYGTNNILNYWSNGYVGIGNGTTMPIYPLTVNGTASSTAWIPFTIYSAAGTALPSCVSGLKGQQATVSDATIPTYLGAYTSGGAVVAPVMCNGSGWVTY